MLERVELRSEYSSFSSFAKIMSLVDDVNRLAEACASLENPDFGRAPLPPSVYYLLHDLVRALKLERRSPRDELLSPATQVANLIVHHLLASLPGWPEVSIVEDRDLLSQQLASGFLQEWALFIRESPESKGLFEDVVRTVARSIPRIVYLERVWPPHYSRIIDDAAIRFAWNVARKQDIEPVGSFVHITVVAAELNSPLLIAFGISLAAIVGVPLFQALRAPALTTAAWRYIDARVRKAEAEASIREEEAAIRAAERREAESRADMAASLASACADIGLQDPEKLVPAMQAMAQPLSRAVSDLRNNDVSIQLVGKGG